MQHDQLPSDQMVSLMSTLFLPMVRMGITPDDFMVMYKQARAEVINNTNPQDRINNPDRLGWDVFSQFFVNCFEFINQQFIPNKKFPKSKEVAAVAVIDNNNNHNNRPQPRRKVQTYSLSNSSNSKKKKNSNTASKPSRETPNYEQKYDDDDDNSNVHQQQEESTQQSHSKKKKKKSKKNKPKQTGRRTVSGGNQDNEDNEAEEQEEEEVITAPKSKNSKKLDKLVLVHHRQVLPNEAERMKTLLAGYGVNDKTCGKSGIYQRWKPQY